MLKNTNIEKYLMGGYWTLYSDTNLTLLWRYSDATLTLLWRYSDATLKLLWRYSDATLTLLWRYSDATMITVQPLTLRSNIPRFWTLCYFGHGTILSICVDLNPTDNCPVCCRVHFEWSNGFSSQVTSHVVDVDTCDLFEFTSFVALLFMEFGLLGSLI
jgi:hypothetical protein